MKCSHLEIPLWNKTFENVIGSNFAFKSFQEWDEEKEEEKWLIGTYPDINTSVVQQLI